jgi:Ca-activated chloride channel family protein
VRFGAETWLLAIFGLPLLALVHRWSDRRARHRLGILLGEQAPGHVERSHPRLRQWRRFLLHLGLFWLLLALARPQWGAHDVVVKEKGTDVVVALDISNSMLAEDVPPSRLERVKAELAGFLASIPRGRFGLVLFAGSAFVQCPLTLDYGTAQIFLRMAAPDMISEQGTNIGSALDVARELLRSGAKEGARDAFKSILLVTDGEDLEGGWEEAVARCRQEAVVIIPVGVGLETGGLIPLTDAQGRSAGFMKDEDGSVVMTRLDLASLQKMAATTGGTAFILGPGAFPGERLQRVIRQLGERELEQRQISAYEERFQWPLALALICFFLRLLLRPRGRARSRPAADPLAVLLIGMIGVASLGVGSAGAAVSLRPAGAADTERGLALYNQGDFEQALQAFQTARVLNPDDPRLSLAIGEALHQMGRHEEAAQEFQRAIVQADSPALKAESLYNAGTSALAAGDPARAAAWLRESLKLAPDQKDARQNLELAMRQLQQNQQNQQDQQDQQGQQDRRNQQGDQGQQDEQRQQGQDQRSSEPQQESRSQDEQEAQPDSLRPPQPEPEQEDASTGSEPPQEQPQPDQAEQPPPAAEDSTAAGSEQPQSAAEPSQEEMSRERALNLLRALDRDEEQMRRSVQKRLRGTGAKSGKRW